MAKQPCYLLALALLLASSACTSPHIHHRPSGRWRQSTLQCWWAPVAVGYGMCQHVLQHSAIYFSALMWQDTVLSASLRSFELAQPGTFYGVPLAQLIAQAHPDTPEMEFVWKKPPNYFNLNLKIENKDRSLSFPLMVSFLPGGSFICIQTTMN